jgi:hypothetical protein
VATCAEGVNVTGFPPTSARAPESSTPYDGLGAAQTPREARARSATGAERSCARLAVGRRPTPTQAHRQARMGVPRATPLASGRTGRGRSASGVLVRRRLPYIAGYVVRVLATLAKISGRCLASRRCSLVDSRASSRPAARKSLRHADRRTGAIALRLRRRACLAGDASAAHDTGRAPPGARPVVWRRRDATQAHQTRPRQGHRWRCPFHSGRTAERAEPGWCPGAST